MFSVCFGHPGALTNPTASLFMYPASASGPLEHQGQGGWTGAPIELSEVGFQGSSLPFSSLNEETMEIERC